MQNMPKQCVSNLKLNWIITTTVLLQFVFIQMSVHLVWFLWTTYGRLCQCHSLIRCFSAVNEITSIYVCLLCSVSNDQLLSVFLQHITLCLTQRQVTSFFSLSVCSHVVPEWLLICTIITIVAKRLEIVFTSTWNKYFAIKCHWKQNSLAVIRLLGSEGYINANVKYVKADIASSLWIVMQN